MYWNILYPKKYKLYHWLLTLHLYYSFIIQRLASYFSQEYFLCIQFVFPHSGPSSSTDEGED